jgi:hypothetical protein
MHGLGGAAHDESPSGVWIVQTHGVANFSFFLEEITDWLCPGAGSLCSVGRCAAVGPGWVFGWRIPGPRRRALSERLPAVPPLP